LKVLSFCFQFTFSLKDHSGWKINHLNGGGVPFEPASNRREAKKNRNGKKEFALKIGLNFSHSHGTN
jgi:hypothetical protein